MRKQVIRARRRGGTPIPRMSAWREASPTTYSPTQGTRWKLPVVVPWRANPDNCAHELKRASRLYRVLRAAELPRSVPGAFVMTAAEWPGTLLHNRRAAKDFQGSIPRGCSRIEILGSSAGTLPGQLGARDTNPTETRQDSIFVTSLIKLIFNGLVSRKESKSF